MTSFLRAVAFLLPALILSAPSAGAADKPRIKILAALAVEPAFPDIKPMIPASTGVEIDIEFAMSPTVVERLNKGEMADLVILTKEGMAGMAKAGEVGQATDLISSDVGIAVADGAPLPVINTADDLVVFLKATPSIAYSKRWGKRFALRQADRTVWRRRYCETESACDRRRVDGDATSRGRGCRGRTTSRRVAVRRREADCLPARGTAIACRVYRGALEAIRAYVRTGGGHPRADVQARGGGIRALGRAPGF